MVGNEKVFASFCVPCQIGNNEWTKSYVIQSDLNLTLLVVFWINSLSRSLLSVPLLLSSFLPFSKSSSPDEIFKSLEHFCHTQTRIWKYHHVLLQIKTTIWHYCQQGEFMFHHYINLSLHPSIHPSSTAAYEFAGSLEPISASLGEGKVHSGRVASSLQGWHIETTIHTHIHTYGQFRVTN